MNAISIKNLTHKYGSRVALDSVDLEVPSGCLFGLLGPNGGGKTTLFKVLVTRLLPNEGAVKVMGTDVIKKPQEARKNIGVLFQNVSLDKKLTVEENLKFAAALFGVSGKLLRSRMDETLESLNLKDRKKDKVEELSGGLARRVDLAKCLLHQPRLLLMDEPSTGLDPGARLDLRTYLRELCENKGMTVFLTTHLMEEADQMDQIGILNGGKMVSIGTPDDLKKKVSGDVITLKSKEAEDLQKKVLEEFKIEGLVAGGILRIEKANAHEFIPKLFQSFSSDIQEITLSRPTLEDVFIRETGHEFYKGSVL